MKHLSPNSRQQHPFRWMALILFVYIGLSIATNLINPLFEAPDEQHHYFTIEHIALTGTLPVATPDTLARQEAAQPPLYYLMGSFLLTPFAPDDLSTMLWPNPHLQFSSPLIRQNINAFVHTAGENWPWSASIWGVHLLRLYSTVLGAGTLLLIYGSGRLLWPESPGRALLAASLVACWPQFIFIHSTVSNDSLIILLSTAVLWQMLRIWSGKMPWSRLVLLGMTIGLAILSKMTGLLLLPLALVVIAGHCWQTGRFRTLLPAMATITLATFLISGWLFWRNWTLYGDITAANQFIALAGGVRPYTLRQIWHDMDRVWRSLFAFFGWMTVQPAPWIHTVWAGLSLLAGAGGLIALTKNRQRISRLSLPAILWHPAIWLAGWWLLVVLAWLQFMRQTPADQGRLWFPAILPMAFGIAYGLTQLPGRGLAVAANGLAFLTAVASLLTIQQAYAPPPILAAPSAIPERASWLDIPWGNGLVLLAAEVEQETAVPGEWVWVTLYWQAARVPDIAPVLQVEALGRDYHLVGQTSTYHGGGLYPANLWPTGAIVADRVGVPLRLSMQTPTRVRLLLPPAANRDRILLAEITVPASDAPALTQDPLAHLGDNANRSPLTLIQADIPVIVAEPGDTITVTLGWQVATAVEQELTAFVHLGDPTQPPVAQQDAPPLAYDYPPRFWQAGDVVTDTFTLTLPDTLPNGRYPLYTGLYDSETAVRLSVTVSGIRQAHDAYFINWISIQSRP